MPGKNGKIVFERSTSAIRLTLYTISPDGTVIRRLVSSGWNPAWSPDGTSVAFSSGRTGPGTDAIWLIDADGSHQRLITSPPAKSVDEEPAWAPDGSQVAFLRTSGSGSYDIWIVNADGTDAHQLTFIGHSTQPSWSPDGTQIAFAVSRVVWVIDVDGTDAHAIPNATGVDPNWSPNGRQIVFQRTGPHIWVINVDGTRPSRDQPQVRHRSGLVLRRHQDRVLEPANRLVQDLDDRSEWSRSPPGDAAGNVDDSFPDWQPLPE
jgi:Tol biopolymer transport system component